MRKPFRSSRLLGVLAVTVLLVATASPGFAFRMIQNNTIGRVTDGDLVTCNDAGGFAHWGSPFISWHLNTANQGSGKNSAVQAAMGSWNAVPNTRHSLGLSTNTTAGWATDGVNTLLWATGNGCIGGCLALTALVLNAGQVIVESDITFNNAVTWTTSGASFDTQAVATHELGHTVGIHHTEVTGTPHPTMFASYFGSDARSLEADDRAALQCSQCAFPTLKIILTGSGAFFASRNIASLQWNASCVDTASVDVFRDGIRIATTSNSGGYTDLFFSSATSANYWVCEAGSTTWYDSATCSNVETIVFR